MLDENKDIRKRNLKLFDYYMRKAYEALLRVQDAGGYIDFSYTTSQSVSWGGTEYSHYACDDGIAKIIIKTKKAFEREEMESNSLEGIECNPEIY